MKEATGELSMTVITIIAVVAILAIIRFLVPAISSYVNKSWNNIANTKVSYVEVIDSYSNM